MLATGAKCVDRTKGMVVLGREIGARRQAPDLTTDRADLMTAALNILVLETMNANGRWRRVVNSACDEDAATISGLGNLKS